MPTLTVDPTPNLIATGSLAYSGFTASTATLAPSPVDYVTAWANSRDDLFSVTVGGIVYPFYWNQIALVGTQTVMSYVQWLNGTPPPNVAGTYPATISFASKIPSFNRTMCTIGDSITWQFFGTYLRGLLLDNGLQYDFIGDHTDPFGLQHSAEGGDTTLDVLDRIAQIPCALSYMLLIGYNDWAQLPVTAFNNILRIVQQLRARNADSKINVCTLLPTTTANDPYIQAVNGLLIGHTWGTNTQLVDLGGYMRAITGWNTLLFDGIHPTLAGYQAIVPWLATQLI